MKKIKISTVIAGVALLAIGYVAGAYIGFPATDKDKLNGDVGLAQAAPSESASDAAVREVMTQDAASQEHTSLSTAFLCSRVDKLDALADAGVKASAGDKNLNEVNKYFSSLKKKTAAAKKNFDALVTANSQKADDLEGLSDKAFRAIVDLDNAISDNGRAGDLLDYARELENQKAADALANWIDGCSANVTASK